MWEDIDEFGDEIKVLNRCAILRLRLTMWHQCLSECIHCLQDRAAEAAIETHPDVDAAQKFRAIFEEVLQQLYRSLDSSMETVSPLRVRINDSTKVFLNDILEVLPTRTRLLTDDAEGETVNYDWKEQLRIAASKTEALAGELQQYTDLISIKIQEKESLHNAMLTASQQIEELI